MDMPAAQECVFRHAYRPHAYAFTYIPDMCTQMAQSGDVLLVPKTSTGDERQTRAAEASNRAQPSRVAEWRASEGWAWRGIQSRETGAN